MKAYPVELRTRIGTAVDHGVGSLPTVAALFGVSINCVANYLCLRSETGSLQPPEGVSRSSSSSRSGFQVTAMRGFGPR